MYKIYNIDLEKVSFRVEMYGRYELRNIQIKAEKIRKTYNKRMEVLARFYTFMIFIYFELYIKHLTTEDCNFVRYYIICWRC